MRKIAVLLPLLMVSAACTSPFNSEVHSLSAAERHPITVDQQAVTLTIPIDSTRSGLSRGDLQQLDRFVSASRTKGYGPITVTAPAGTGRDLEANETAAAVRAALNDSGVAYADIQGASVTSSTAKEVMVSFVRYVAQGPQCGVFDNERAARFRNLSHPNFGCSSQHNLAAMIADPRDLTRAQSTTTRDGHLASKPINTQNTVVIEAVEVELD